MQYATEENLTDLAVVQWQACHSQRLRTIMQSLVKYLHGFVREVELTREEWLFAADWLAKTGQLSSEKRQEFILLSDVLGISMLVDAINHRWPPGATPSTVIGPFHIEDSPELPMGTNIAEGLAGETCFVLGAVRNLDGEAIEGAKLDIWQADADGMYESQLGLDEPFLRAIFRTAPDGKYVIHTIAPPGYSIPMDGTVGDLMKETDISHYRPAHIHFSIFGAGLLSRLVTQMYFPGDPLLALDPIYNSISSAKDKQRLISSFDLATTTPEFALGYRFDIVLRGRDATPMEK